MYLGDTIAHIVVKAMWTVDIAQGSSVVELTRVSGVPGPISSPVICLQCIYTIYMLIPQLHCIWCRYQTLELRARLTPAWEESLE